MDKDKLEYILNYFGNLMTENEAAAWKHWMYNYKIAHSDSSEDQKKKRTQLYIERGLLSTDEKVLELLDAGIDHFKEKTTKRILEEYANVLEFNDCPKCSKLARTPLAKQCRFCGYDWH